MVERFQGSLPENPQLGRIHSASEVLLARYGLINRALVGTGRMEITGVNVKGECFNVASKLKTDLGEEFGIPSQVTTTANFSPNHYYLLLPDETPHPPEQDILLDPTISQYVLGLPLFLGTRGQLHELVLANRQSLLTEITDTEFFFDAVWGTSSAKSRG